MTVAFLACCCSFHLSDPGKPLDPRTLLRVLPGCAGDTTERLAAHFASRPSDSRRGVGPSSRSAYRTSPPGPRRGLPRFARTSCDRGGCLLCPEDGGAHPGWAGFPAGACRFPAASPCAPLPLPPAELAVTRHRSEVYVLHPSDLPLACGPRMERAPLGFCLMLRTPPGTPATHVRPRPGHEHGPGTTPSILLKPPINAFTQYACDLASQTRPACPSPGHVGRSGVTSVG